MAQGFILNKRRKIEMVTFKVTIDTSLSSNLVALMFASAYKLADFTIKWGDGSSEHYNSPQGNVTHNYSNYAKYQISISGKFMFESFSSLSDVTISIDSWGELKYLKTPTIRGGFWGFKNLEVIPDEPLPNLGQVSLSDWFFGTEKLKKVPDNFLTKCYGVQDIYSMFYNSGIEEVGNNFAKGLTRLTDGRSVFRNCNNLRKVGDGTYDGCINLNSINGLCYGNSNLITVGENQFRGCRNLLYAQNVYGGCENLLSIPNRMFYDCKKGRSYWRTFYNTGSCELPAEMFDYTSLSTIIGLDMFVETFGSNNGKSHTGTAYPLWEYYPNVDHTLCYQNQTNLTNYNDIPSDWK